MPISLTPDQAVVELRARGHEARDVVALSGGLWSAAFAFREDDRDLVVRFHDRRDDLEKDRFASRWIGPDLHTPRVIEIGESNVGPYSISERVRGGPLDDLDENGMRAALPSLLRALDALRGADLAGTSGFGLWHGDGTAESSSWRDLLLGANAADHRAERQLLAGTPVGTSAFDIGVERVRELVSSCPEERHLVHNDLLNYNVFADRGNVILLDWGASIFGDFLYDAALLTFWWPWTRKWAGIDVCAAIEDHYAESGLVVPSFADRLRCYELHIGVRHIHFQASHGRFDDAAWTARRTLELANAPP